MAEMAKSAVAMGRRCSLLVTLRFVADGRGLQRVGAALRMIPEHAMLRIGQHCRPGTLERQHQHAENQK